MIDSSHRQPSVYHGLASGARSRDVDLASPLSNRHHLSQITKRPEAEVLIDTETVRALIRSQHPDLADLPLSEIATGWDNVTFRLGEGMAVRLPRRVATAATLEHEQRWLPTIADRLPVPVPAPLRIGKPSHECPFPWSIVPWLPGETGDLEPLNAEQAKPLAHFLRTLHVAAPVQAPKNRTRGIPLQERAPAVEERLHRLAQKTQLINLIVVKSWESALEAPQAEVATWIHGDLHPQNILVEHGELRGVIDWADIASGDNATDLACIWMLLPTVAARESAMAEYGNVPAATWARALGWAVNLGTVLLETGLVDNPRHAAIGELTLQRIAEGPH
jgi:aminoglycoside phosphotransferase (APT) family kinase protein